MANNICELRGGTGCMSERYVIGESEVKGLITSALEAYKVPASALPTIPTATTSMPAEVADLAKQGTDPTKFDPAGHQHPSKARKERKTGVNTATYVWTYPNAFKAGVIPIVQVTTEDPADSASDEYGAQVVGVPTNTQCTIRIKRKTIGLFALLTGALGFNPLPGTINLHLTALEP